MSSAPLPGHELPPLDLPTFWLDTASGQRVDLTDPDPSGIRLADVAGGLSRVCRFGGQAREYFSVAQHALLVERVVGELGYDGLRLAALHHDSHEAYLCDLPSPLKKVLSAAGDFETYRHLCAGFDRAIAMALDIPMANSAADVRVIDEADAIAFEIEAHRLLPLGSNAAIVDHHGDRAQSIVQDCPEPMSPVAAAEAFEMAHRRLVCG